MPERTPREPKPLADLLPLLISGRGWGERMALGRLREAWPAIVGDHVAARSEPVALVRGALTVRAEGGAWAAELTLLGGTVAAAANRFLGEGSVRSVKVSAGPLRGESESP